MRRVFMNQKQYEDIEKYIEHLLRTKQNERAARMMTLSLSYRFTKDIGEPEEDSKKVIPLHAYLSRVAKDSPSANSQTRSA